MARGWESKSVEAQIDEAAQRRKIPHTMPISREQVESMKRRESLLLSRKRVINELEGASNPRYRQLMQRSLAELDAQLASLK